eukprot:3940569-Rhodomonas_salina.2
MRKTKKRPNAADACTAEGTTPTLTTKSRYLLLHSRYLLRALRYWPKLCCYARPRYWPSLCCYTRSRYWPSLCCYARDYRLSAIPLCAALLYWSSVGCYAMPGTEIACKRAFRDFGDVSGG